MRLCPLQISLLPRSKRPLIRFRRASCGRPPGPTMKTTLAELAILGGPPAFVEPLHVGRPNIGDRTRFLERVGEMLDRRWPTKHGPFVKEFSRARARLLGGRPCRPTRPR